MLSGEPIRVSLRHAEIRMKADIGAASMVAGTFRWCASDLASRSKTESARVSSSEHLAFTNRWLVSFTADDH